jgi:hypothetical protein
MPAARALVMVPDWSLARASFACVWFGADGFEASRFRRRTRYSEDVPRPVRLVVITSPLGLSALANVPSSVRAFVSATVAIVSARVVAAVTSFAFAICCAVLTSTAAATLSTPNSARSMASIEP